MRQEEIDEIIRKQREFFESGKTLDVEYRINALRHLRHIIARHEKEIDEALKKDLGKGPVEGYMCETGMVLSELSYMIKHTAAFAREKNVITPLAQFASRSFVKPSPLELPLYANP